MAVPEAVGPVVLARNDRFVVLAKPAGMPSQPDRTGDPDLLSWVRNECRIATAGPVHRLDRPVSGVMLFACTGEALAVLNAQFNERTIGKTYWAIVEGAVDGISVLENTIMHDAKRKKARIDIGEDAKQALLHVRALVKGDRYTLVEVKPDGGAFHQIRAQLGAAGHAIKGDVKYGARRGEKDRSIALHARSIEFNDPMSGERVGYSAPAPSTPLWAKLIELLGQD
jgi:23S rRNA pseudouridine1911/1915/1917 synthase